MPDKPRDDLHYFKWEVIDAKALQHLLEMGAITLANVGELFLAVMAYVNQEDVEISPELRVLFATYKVRVDNNREARVKVGISRAENGQKGGLAKAENSLHKNPGFKFTTPTQKKFRDAVKHFVDMDEILESITDYDADSFFDELAENGWTIGGVPIQSREDWEAAISAKFCKNDDITLPSYLPYMIFSTVFTEIHDGSKSNEIMYDFIDSYDKASKSWKVEGESFCVTDWKSALSRFMEGHINPSNT